MPRSQRAVCEDHQRQQRHIRQDYDIWFGVQYGPRCIPAIPEFLADAQHRGVPRKFSTHVDCGDAESNSVTVPAFSGAAPGGVRRAVLMFDVVTAARKLPTEMDLTRVSRIVINSNPHAGLNPLFAQRPTLVHAATRALVRVVPGPILQLRSAGLRRSFAPRRGGCGADPASESSSRGILGPFACEGVPVAPPRTLIVHLVI